LATKSTEFGKITQNNGRYAVQNHSRSPILVPIKSPRPGTTNDSSDGTTSPVEAKIIVGGPHTHHGWGGNVGSIYTDACFDTCVPGQQSEGQQLAFFW